MSFELIMDNARFSKLSDLLYCICPYCKTSRKKLEGKFTIIKRGRERDGAARFLCLECDTWFNERTGNTMGWMGRG